MVQIDVLLSYSFASGLALAAKKPLMKETTPWANKYYVTALAWTAGLFVPVGIYLILQFPAWETMFVAKSTEDVTPVGVALFALSLVIMATVGFGITWHLLKTNQEGRAKGLLVASMILSLAILTLGWDGTGWRRFLYSGSGTDWEMGLEIPWQNFFSSEIAKTLFVLGILFGFSYGGILWRWHKESHPKF